ncbi:MAG: hypothetical protein RL323_2038, partial [Pseudomonadota bacterium]
MSLTSLPNLVQTWRQWRLWFVSLISATLLAACGGGELVGGVGSGGTGAYGSIIGFGSIIVNGVRYKDDNASVFDDSGNAIAQSDLKLGMVVEVSGDDVVAGVNGALPTSNATQVYVHSEIKGPVSAITGSVLTVLGQTVNTTASTVFDLTLPAGLSSVQVNQVLEVYGYVDAQGTYTATRIELEDNTSSYKIRGFVTNLNTTQKTLQIGTAVIHYGAVASLPTNLADGKMARIELDPTPVSPDHWTATRLTISEVFGSGTITSGLKAEIEGVVTSFTSATQFSVNGVPVNASGVSALPAGLALGSSVEVKGTLTNGVLTATEVSLEDSSSSGVSREFEVHGLIETLDTVAQTLLVRGVTINYATAQFKDGTASNLSAGVAVEIKGVLNSAGTLVTATQIGFEDLDNERSTTGYEVTGAVSGLNSTNKTFVVRGVTVDYSSATFEDGTLSNLANSAIVEVKGTPVNNILKASRIKFEDLDDDSQSSGSGSSS